MNYCYETYYHPTKEAIEWAFRNVFTDLTDPIKEKRIEDLRLNCFLYELGQEVGITEDEKIDDAWRRFRDTGAFVTKGNFKPFVSPLHPDAVYWAFKSDEALFFTNFILDKNSPLGNRLYNLYLIHDILAFWKLGDPQQVDNLRAGDGLKLGDMMALYDKLFKRQNDCNFDSLMYN